MRGYGDSGSQRRTCRKADFEGGPTTEYFAYHFGDAFLAPPKEVVFLFSVDADGCWICNSGADGWRLFLEKEGRLCRRSL